MEMTPSKNKTKQNKKKQEGSYLHFNKYLKRTNSIFSIWNLCVANT